MEKFLKKLADHIHDTIGDQTRQACIVLPNRRAGLFLKKHLAARYQKNIWAPAVFAIEDFVTHHTPYRQAEPAVLLFELFQVHKTFAGEEMQTFEEVMAWGPILLEDLNEIDLYLADAQKIFTYLEEEKAITLWHPDGSPLTEMEKKYLAFFQSLKNYYALLKERLTDQNLAYQGMAYRYFFDHIEEIVPALEWKKILFAGFNALTLAEEKIIRSLLDKGVAEVLWDADRYYLEDARQEAGEFLRSYFSTWSNRHRQWIGDDLEKGKKEIAITGVAGNIGQVKYAGQILSGLDTGKHLPENTAVVLADESMLIPLLNSVPGQYPDVNITMGYPLSLTPLYVFMQAIVSLHENAEKKALIQKGSRQIYIRDLMRVISHPSFRLLSRKDESEISRIKSRLIASKQVFYAGEEVSRELPELGEWICHTLFMPWKNPEGALQNLSSVIEVLRDGILAEATGSGRDLRLETEFLFHYAKLITKVRDLTRKYGGIENIRSLRKLMEVLGRGSKIPFIGEPLKGLQVMGVLETRTLDFETIILLSTNENIIPASRNYQSFVPFEVKRHFRLPTFRDKDAIYAYHFYRMLQKAQNIHILYNTEPDALSGGEKSRFITQMLYEMPKANPSVNITEQILHSPPVLENLVAEFSIPKTKEVIAALFEKAASGFSPSSLAAYIHCPLQFFLRSIAGLEEEEDLEETLDAATLGSVVHSALQRLYEDPGRSLLTKEDLQAMLRQVPVHIENAFREHYPGGNIRHGKNLLIYRVASLFARRFIEREADEMEATGETLEIDMLEEELTGQVMIDDGVTPLEVKIRGKIDRADRWGGRSRIIDYKTGFVKEADLKVKDWQEVMTDPKFSKAFQLMIYAMMYRGAEGALPLNGLPGIISLRAPSKGFMPVVAPEENIDQSIDRFTEALRGLLGEIFDPALDFGQTEDAERCKYCSFRNLCQR